MNPMLFTFEGDSLRQWAYQFSCSLMVDMKLIG